MKEFGRNEMKQTTWVGLCPSHLSTPKLKEGCSGSPIVTISGERDSTEHLKVLDPA